MLNLNQIRNHIVASLFSALNVPVVPSDDDGNVPAYPFVYYTFTSPYIDQYGWDSEWYEAEGVQMRKTSSKIIEVVMSFTAVSPKMDVATNICMAIKEHFDRTARESLSDLDIVVVNLSNAQNRSVMITDHYERRWGMDVRFRVRDTSSILSDTYIETTKINDGSETA